jgi:hypothetical protein
MFKKTAVALILFLASFAACFGQGGRVPTTGSNNVWTGNNSFLYHSFVLNQGNSCGAGQAMIGYQSDFTPICATFAGGGVTLLNSLTGNIVITNGDSNLSVSESGQNIEIFCPGCSSGGGGNPGGSPGAIQYQVNGTTFGGVNITGLVFGQGASAPRQAVAGSDYQAPFTISCGTGLSCSFGGSTWTLTPTGSAGTGDVASAVNGQLGGYLSTGTTISGAPNVFVLNPAWNLNQMNGLITRFIGTSISSWSITSNVATFQAVNAYNAGDSVYLLGFPTSTFFNDISATVLSSGLSNTQFEVAFTHANGSATETGNATFNIPFQANNSQGLIIVPPGLQDQPSNATSNISQYGPAAQFLDWRRGYGLQQASTYGVKCDLQSRVVTLTNGSPDVAFGADFAAGINPVGMTMVAYLQSGYGATSTQADWEPTIQSIDGFGNAVMSGNSPLPTGSYSVELGTNNQLAFQRMQNDVGGGIPVWLPQCGMLTDTIRWKGMSLIGQMPEATLIAGFPGKDILQQQDGVPITAWSINTSTGLTTFTIPAYSAHSIIATLDYPTNPYVVGDTVTLASFGTSTFFNNQSEVIYSHPTPTTFTVQSVFGQSTSSATEAGVAEPTTAANQPGLRMENLTLAVNNGIDPSFAWTHYSPTSASTVEPPMYRPLQTNEEPANDPLAPGWGTGVGGENTTNGVAIITQNSAVICVPTTLASLPAVGSALVFPYQTGGLVSRTVSSTAGSCSSGYDPFTLSSALPNTSGYTATQAEWFDYGTPQELAVAIGGTISLPYTVTLATPFPPIPGWPSNVSSHGHIIIGNQEWDYMGDSFGGTAGGTPQIVLVNGPTTVNGGTGWPIGSVVFPLNPCQAMYHNPWPVVPNINGATSSTPKNAAYYPGLCGGNAAMSFPSADAYAWAPRFGLGGGINSAHFIDVYGGVTSSNALGNQNNNGSMMMYQAANYTGYDNTFDHLVANGLWGGFMQGPSGVNEWGLVYYGIGPTSTGQSIKNCTFRVGYSLTLVLMSQSNLDRCDNYSTETSPYDGTAIGGTTSLFIGDPLDEQTGTAVPGGVGQFTVKDYNAEPENGNHEEFPPSVISDGSNITWIGNIFEGGFNIFGGQFQQFHGTQMAGPTFNYGSNNWFEKLHGLSYTYNTGVYNNTLGFWDWGTFTTCQAVFGGASQNGPQQGCGGPGYTQSYDGHDIWASMMGNGVNPDFNLIGGMVSPDEIAYSGYSTYFDSTELWWGKHWECPISSASDCIVYTFGGGPLLIGPYQRLVNAPMVLKANLMAKNSGNETFNIQLYAENPGLGTCSVGGSPALLANQTVTALSSGWTPVQVPVDFTGYQGCGLRIQYIDAGTTNVIETGYFNFVPFASQLYIPLGTPTLNASCPVAGEIKLDTTYMWMCMPLSGHAFGAGTWGQILATK